MIILLALVVIADKAVGLAFVTLKDYGLKVNPEYKSLKTSYVVEKMDADVLIVGSSRAEHHYIPDIISDSLGVSVYNCGQRGGRFLYQNCVINMVLDRYTPKKILWDFLPGCMIVSGDNEKEYRCVRYLSPYYGKNKWTTEFINSEDKMSAVKMRCQMFAFNSRLPSYLAPFVRKGATTQNGYVPLPSEGYEYPVLNSDYMDDSKYEPDLKKFELFASTIERCKREGVELLLIASPRYSYSSRAYMCAVSDLRKMAAEYGYEIYDYADLYLDDPTRFKDSGHMNHKGAMAFTEMVIEKHLRSER